MPDFFQPYRSDSSSGGLQTLKDMMDLKQKQQSLQSGALTIQGQQQGLQGQAADVQVKQQGAAQNAAAGRFFQNFDLSKHIKDDGTLDLDSAMTSPDLKATGSDAPDIIQKLVGIKNSQLAAKQSLAGVNGTLRDQFRQTVGGLAADPDVASGNQQGKGKVLDAIDQFAQSGGPDAERIASIYKPVFQNAPPNKLGAVLKNSQLQALSAEKQAEATKPDVAPVQGRAGINYVNKNPNAPQPVGAQIGQPVTDQGVSPETKLPQALVTPAGVINRNPLSGSLSAPSQAAPNLNPSQAQAVSAVDNAKVISGNIETARTAGDQYGLNSHINNRLLELSKSTDTGPGTSAWHHALGVLGAPFGASPTKDYDLINAYLDRQASTNAAAMGLPNTNAGLATSQSLSGNTSYSPQALQEKIKLNDTLNEATNKFRKGLDRAVGVGANPDSSAYQAYRSAWAQNFDPQVFAVDAAMKRGDKEELAKIRSTLTPQQATALAQKTANLRKLEQGQIPQ